VRRAHRTRYLPLLQLLANGSALQFSGPRGSAIGAVLVALRKRKAKEREADYLFGRCRDRGYECAGTAGVGAREEAGRMKGVIDDR
jgi:hypothetical protein